MKGQSPDGLKHAIIIFHLLLLSTISASRKSMSLLSIKWVKLTTKTRISFHYEYASVVMMGLTFPGVKQRDALKHI